MARTSKVVTYVILALALGLRPVLISFLKFHAWPLDERIGTIPSLSLDELKSHYKGQHALLIGGTRGVGFGVATNLAQAGAHVTLVGRNAQMGNAACQELYQYTYYQQTTCTYVTGDIGSVASATRLLDQLAAASNKYDLLVVSAATFPDWSQPTLLQEDGLDTSWAIAVLGRFLVYRRMHEFLRSQKARVLNVLASGESIAASTVDRTLVSGERQASSLQECITQFAIGNEVMQIMLQNKDPNVSSVTRVSTHPGLIQTELHRGQGLAFDIIEQVSVWLAGISEEEAGLRQASILASDKLQPGQLNYVGQFQTGAERPDSLQQEVDEHGEWLWSFLLEMEAKAKPNMTSSAKTTASETEAEPETTTESATE